MISLPHANAFWREYILAAIDETESATGCVAPEVDSYSEVADSLRDKVTNRLTEIGIETRTDYERSDVSGPDIEVAKFHEIVSEEHASAAIMSLIEQTSRESVG